MNGKRKTLGILGPALLALTMGNAIADAQVTAPVPLALRTGAAVDAGGFGSIAVVSGSPRGAGTGRCRRRPMASVTPVPTGNSFPANPLLMTDGTVIVHINLSMPCSFEGTRTWFQLIPDINGSYVNGTWSTFASLPAGYGAAIPRLCRS